MTEIAVGALFATLLAAVYCAVVEYFYSKQADEKDDELGEEGDE